MATGEERLEERLAGLRVIAGVIAENNAVIAEGLRAHRELLEAERSGDAAAVAAGEAALAQVNERTRERVEASKLAIAGLAHDTLD